MGVRIFGPDKVTQVIIPFPKSMPERTVQVLCNLQTNSCTLRFRKCMHPGKAMDQLFIEFSTAEFSALAKLGGGQLNTFAQSLKNHTPRMPTALTVAMNAAMHQCLFRLSQHRTEAAGSALSLFALVTELLALVDTTLAQAEAVPNRYIKNEYDRERILYARDYLLTHLDAPPSLPQLAAIVGMNEFKLKRGFKEVFNQPPFTYLAGVRLEMARTALEKKEKNITQIAFELGYASLQHFSAAFKKKFGVPPGRFS